MLKIESIDRESLRIIRIAMQSKVDEVAKEYGLHIKVGNITFSSNNATIKLNVSTVSKDGQTNTRESNAYLHYAPLVGLKTDWLGKWFDNGLRKYKIVGYLPKSRKYPVLAEDNCGKQFKFKAETVRHGMPTE